MRVLLTNNTLAQRGGSELYVRDVAIELMRRGHQPVAYSTLLGEVAEELRQATVPVIRTLESMGEPPDIIHGQHHYETLTAMLWFPGVPAIHYCHGWLPWEEAPLRYPGIRRYVAVDEVCRERLIAEGGIAPEQIEVILNFFDQSRFPRRAALPRAPARALVFSNEFSERADLPVLREACSRCGIELDVMGIAAGKPEQQPGPLLAKYDVVFAKARAAIEAMAVGAAVVLCKPGRLGPMVTTGDFESLRRLNFGIRTLSRPLDADSLEAELRRYDAGEAAAVTELARERCEMQPAVDRIVRLYEAVIAEARPRRAATPAEWSRAVAGYLEESAGQYKQSALAEDRLRWAVQCQAAERALEQREARLREIEGDRARWMERCAAESLNGRHARNRELELEGLLAAREADLRRAEREAAALRSSACWRLTQGVLQSWPAQRLFGRFIRSIAESSQRKA